MKETNIEVGKIIKMRYLKVIQATQGWKENCMKRECEEGKWKGNYELHKYSLEKILGKGKPKGWKRTTKTLRDLGDGEPNHQIF